MKQHRQVSLLRDIFQLRHTGVIGELVGGLQVAQSFRSPQDLLCTIDLFMTTYGRMNETRLTVSLRRETPDGEELARITVPATSLRDNDWTRFEFDPILIAEGKTFVVLIKSEDAIPGHGVAVHHDNSGCLEDGQLWIAGREQPGALKFRTYYLPRADLLPVSRPLVNHLAAAIPAMSPESIPLIASNQSDLAVSEILRTIQRINRDKNNQVRQLQHHIHELQDTIDSRHEFA